MKHSDYDVVEQLRKTPAKISILSLILNSEIHRKALLKTLGEAYVQPNISVEKAVNLVNAARHASVISFYGDEVHPQQKALHITVKCQGFNLAKVLIDGGSSLNLLPASTFHQLPKDPSELKTSEMVVRAFDGTRREVMGEVTLPIEIGPCTFDITFQVMNIEAAYTMLLGRPWIHQAKAVPSTLHQKLKFIRGGHVITVCGEEELLISKPTEVPYIDCTEEAVEASFQNLELEPKEKDDEMCINYVIGRIMKGLGYQKGRGLGPALDGVTQCWHPPERRGRFGLGYNPPEGKKTNKRRGNYQLWRGKAGIPSLRDTFPSSHFLHNEAGEYNL